MVSAAPVTKANPVVELSWAGDESDAAELRKSDTDLESAIFENRLETFVKHKKHANLWKWVKSVRKD